MKSILTALIALFLIPTGTLLAETHEADIVIYGGTSAGLVAGFQAIEMGKSAIVVEPTHHLGGLTTGGLGQTDIGNKFAVGGLSREFYRRVRRHYADDDNWDWQARENYRDSGQTRTGENEDTMWTFEPSAASTIYADWIEETGLDVLTESPMVRDGGSGVKKEDGRIVAIVLENGDEVRGEVFIDATYEGDLLAEAGVDYVVGRESCDEFDETLNGVQTAEDREPLRGGETRNSKNHQFVDGVDPYVVAGDPSSGLLPFIDPEGPGEEMEGDHRVQAYCFRACYTDHPENRIPFAKPDGYREDWYELLFRNFEAGEDRIPWINSAMPNRKTDTNNKQGFSSDFIGQNYDYPEASYAERREIEARHRLYQQGLMWALANHPRVPEKIRSVVSQWGTCKDEFTDPREPGNGWQSQLYVREGRRMRGEMVMTQHHCERLEIVPDSIGMAAYGMDSHHVQRYVTEDGHVRNEGNVQAHVKSPYPISYRALTPKREQAENLLVPVSLSSTHIAFGSIRMEPVFMVLGQSAATAAALAIDSGVAVQDVDYKQLRARLLADDQVLNLPDSEPEQAANAPSESAEDRSESRPNFLVIYADDLGFETLGCYGGLEFSTPNLDRLAAEGMRFDQAYTSPLCTPSRMSLYTGRYTVNHGYDKNIPVHLGSRDKVDFETRWTTWADVLGDAGYEVSITGKWQLAALEFHPNHLREAGFDSWCVWQIWRDGEKTTRYWNPVFNQDGRVLDHIADRFGPDVLADYVIDRMRSAAEEDKPFYIQHNMLLPHFPIVPTPTDKEAGREKGSLGSMIACMDEICGRLAEAVDEMGIAEETYIIFMGDNGTDAKKPRRTKSGLVEGGKRDLTEAGTRIPLIVRRPGVVETGAVIDSLVDMADWFPTFCELAGAEIPDDLELDGTSFASTIRTGEPTSREWITAAILGDAKVFDGEKWWNHKTFFEKHPVEAP